MAGGTVVCRGRNTLPSSSNVWLSKLWSLFGSLLEYGTYYLGYSERDHNFDNYPNEKGRLA